MKIEAQRPDAQVYRFRGASTLARAGDVTGAAIDRRLLTSETAFSSQLHDAMAKTPHVHIGAAESPEGLKSVRGFRDVTDLQRVLNALLIEL